MEIFIILILILVIAVGLTLYWRLADAIKITQDYIVNFVSEISQILNYYEQLNNININTLADQSQLISIKLDALIYDYYKHLHQLYHLDSDKTPYKDDDLSREFELEVLRQSIEKRAKEIHDKYQDK